MRAPVEIGVLFIKSSTVARNVVTTNNYDGRVGFAIYFPISVNRENVYRDGRTCTRIVCDSTAARVFLSVIRNNSPSRSSRAR